MYTNFKVDSNNLLLMHGGNAVKQGANAEHEKSAPQGLLHGTIGQGLTTKLIAKNNASRLFDMSLGKMNIEDDIKAY
jgi:hypothetical protein